MLEDFKDIMTVAEVAKVLHVGKNKVYELLETGVLSGFRIGRVWKIPREALDEYINSEIQKQDDIKNKRYVPVTFLSNGGE